MSLDESALTQRLTEMATTSAEAECLPVRLASAVFPRADASLARMTRSVGGGRRDRENPRRGRPGSPSGFPRVT